MRSRATTQSPVPAATPWSATTGTSTAPGLGWEHVKRHRSDALWYFCGEHPSGFSTSATLRARGYSDPAHVEWSVRQGADKVYAAGGYRGPEITVFSSAGSRRAGDVHIEVREQTPGGTATSHVDHLTVRTPHRLAQLDTNDTPGCPPGGPAGCTGFLSRIRYRILDNVGGTIVGATVNERFPGPAVDDQPNRWRASTVTSGSAWPNTDGTFVDNLYKCCGIPAPVGLSSPHYGDTVYHEPHEFYVGSTTPGRGCRVQRHTLQFFRGYADHEYIRSPAP